MRRAAALALCISGLLLFGCADSAEQSTELAPPFWLAEDADTGGRLYLLGSMHVGREDTHYPDYVMDAYEESTTIAAEIDTTVVDEAAYEAAKHLYCPEGTTTRDMFGEHYDEAAAFFKRMGLYSSGMDRLIPYFWGSSLTVAAAEDIGLYSEYGTEEHFLTLAHKDEKDILELESYDEQYRMMSEIPLSVQVQSVMTAVGTEQYKKLTEDTLALYEAWSVFDEAALEALDKTVYNGITDELSEDYAVFMDEMYFSRQEHMADSAVQLLQSGGTSFMLVGAAHFYIEQDILTLLEEKGYHMTEIRPETAAEAA